MVEAIPIGSNVAQKTRGNTRLIIPDEKFEKLEAILAQASSAEVISFQTLEKLARNCTSMAVAYPAAALYPHERQGGQRRDTDIVIAANGG